MGIITIEEAMKRAFWRVKLPSMFVLIFPLLVVIVMSKGGFIPSKGAEALKWFGPAFAISFVGGWLIWSIQVPRWRLWAYQRVESVFDLKSEAVRRQLIWPEGSFFQKTEIAPKEIWAEIKKFEASSNENS